MSRTYSEKVKEKAKQMMGVNMAIRLVFEGILSDGAN
jgi:hypothetical protein